MCPPVSYDLRHQIRTNAWHTFIDSESLFFLLSSCSGRGRRGRGVILPRKGEEGGPSALHRKGASAALEGRTTARRNPRAH
eukprot:8047223-Pyramimonas_sp.AAC.1